MYKATIEPYLLDDSWLKALSLEERLAHLEELNLDQSRKSSAGYDLAQKRFERWQSQPPFFEADYLTRRLEAARLTESEFFYLLGESPESLSDRLRHNPQWRIRVEEAFLQKAFGTHTDTSSLNEVCGPEKFDGFIKGITPLINQDLSRLRDGIIRLREKFTHLPFKPDEVIELFVPGLIRKLTSYAARTITLELNVARLRGVLKGASPKERFDHFKELIAQPEFLVPILHEYPVLTRQIVRAIDYWARSCMEVLTNLCADWSEIVKTFLPEEETGPLTEISDDVGDMHRNGRAVRILTFESGLRLVYKPHSLSVDIHFGELLKWLNERKDDLQFRTIKVIDHKDHGWAEFIKPLECFSEAEMHRFYQRQGGLLALLYALDATDFHFENLIASGEHPVLIDLESLFHPRMKPSSSGAQGHAPASQTLSNSVMRIGMLPHRIWSVDEQDGVDISGLGGAAGQMTPFTVLTFENQSTDEMRVVRSRVEIPGAQNRPALQGKALNLQDYTGDIIEGFTSVYRLLLQERALLTANDGPLSVFGEDEVRAVLRPTQVYGIFLTESYHPDMLRDGLDRSRHFDRLWESIKSRPEYSEIVPSEIRDLQQGDIPFFCCRPCSRDLWTSNGQRIGNFFEEDSLSVVRRRIGQLNEEDLARQTWFIAASMASLTHGIDRQPLAHPLFKSTNKGAGRERLLAAARLIADRLDALAIRDEENVNWIGLTFLNGGKWTLLPLSDDLYNGTLGIALFLTYAGDVLQEERYTALARTILLNAKLRAEALIKEIKSPYKQEGGFGGYHGIGAVIQTFAHVAQTWKDRSFLHTAEMAVELLSGLIRSDETLDIIGGSAGCILNLLSLYHCTSSSRSLAAATLCADQIIQKTQPQRHGLAWNTVLKGSRPLTGFSHGVAGIAHALLSLAAVTGEENYRHVALEAFAYEESVFSFEESNWPDFREEGAVAVEDGDSFMVAWCHGAPGIGLARLNALRHVSDERFLADVEIAIQTTLKKGFGLNHSLCHGDLGNLEFLFEAGRLLGKAGLLDEVKRRAATILDSIEQQGWICGTPGGTETPGLMTGLAGIGYGLLRLAEPERVPSVLMLAAPPKEVVSQITIEDRLTESLKSVEA
jgi:type 2 lantibiotic biosynthesis protein LanM